MTTTNQNQTTNSVPTFFNAENIFMIRVVNGRIALVHYNKASNNYTTFQHQSDNGASSDALTMAGIDIAVKRMVNAGETAVIYVADDKALRAWSLFSGMKANCFDVEKAVKAIINNPNTTFLLEDKFLPVALTSLGNNLNKLREVEGASVTVSAMHTLFQWDFIAGENEVAVGDIVSVVKGHVSNTCVLERPASTLTRDNAQVVSRSYRGKTHMGIRRTFKREEQAVVNGLFSRIEKLLPARAEYATTSVMTDVELAF